MSAQTVLTLGLALFLGKPEGRMSFGAVSKRVLQAQFRVQSALFVVWKCRSFMGKENLLQRWPELALPPSQGHWGYSHSHTLAWSVRKEQVKMSWG